MLLSAGSDGIDGNSDAAGAVVDDGTIDRMNRLGLDPDSYLSRNDAYHFFRQTGDLLFTGPTGTNVMDMQILYIGG
jgi:hydroxypyruvate reductase/glycerate 2-kinase